MQVNYLRPFIIEIGFFLGMRSRLPSLFSGRRERARIVGAAVFLVALCLATAAPAARAQESVFTLDPAQTKIGFTLGATLHSVHGTFRLKSGQIQFDPATGAASGAVIVDATSGESGNDSRDRKMHKEIIESQKYPEIVFTPRHVAGQLTELAGGQGTTSELQVSGTFRLLGQDHEMTIPVSVKSSDGPLQVSSHFAIPYIQWGLKNPNTFVLRVSSIVNIEIQASGRIGPASSSQ